MKDRKISFEVVVGSHNYLLNHAKSDMDKKAFFYPSFTDLYNGDKKSPVSKSKTLDVEFHDLRKLPNMLYKANVNFLEVLFSVRVFQGDDLYQALYAKREDIARMNLPYLFEACFTGMFERKVGEFLRDTAYINVNESDKEREEKVNKHLMVATRILDFLNRYAKNGFTSFESAIRYYDHIEEDRQMKKFLFDVREGKIKKTPFSFDLPEFLLKKKAEVEALKPFYKAQPVNEQLRSELEELIKQHVMLNVHKEITELENQKHDWEPVDSQGYEMQCCTCGQFIALMEQDVWKREINAVCKSKMK